ncbi:MAG: T9SS type A sorting domain-containing protein [Chitinophagales bacterium]|jgi:PKD repeat protein|nr:T9SS type A sorting domain-containing protein [Chitinophagales bacterium]
MKKNSYTLLILLLIGLFANTTQAQPTIDVDDMPYPGYTKGIATQNNPPIDPGIASSNEQTWNFTQLSANSFNILTFEDPATSPFVGAFPGSNLTRNGDLPSLLGISLGDLLPIPIDLLPATGFYTKDAEGIVRSNGIHTNISIPGLIDLGPQDLIADPQDIFLAPLNYGESLASEGAYELTYNFESDTLPIPIPITLQVNLSKNLNADAYGTLELPDSTYKVVRYQENTVANIFVGVLLFGVPVQTFIDTTFNLTTYRFLANGENYPVATITMTPSGEPTPLSIEYFGEQGPLGASYNYTTTCLTVDFTNTSSNAIAYNWDFGTGITSSQISPVYTFPEPGTYTVQLTAIGADGLTATTSKEITVDFCDGIERPEQQLINAYPNPAHQTLSFDLSQLPNNTAYQYQLSNSIGQIVQQAKVTAATQNIDVSQLPSGNYFLTIKDATGLSIALQKVMIW